MSAKPTTQFNNGQNLIKTHHCLAVHHHGHHQISNTLSAKVKKTLSTSNNAMSSKGQLISKELFAVIVLTKRPAKKLTISALESKK